VGDALIALGDVLLAAFPEMRDRFRNAIKATVKAAETAVNALAENLKKEVQAALFRIAREGLFISSGYCQQSSAGSYICG
jgi:signal transduction histidine kinase